MFLINFLTGSVDFEIVKQDILNLESFKILITTARMTLTNMGT